MTKPEGFADLARKTIEDGVNLGWTTDTVLGFIIQDHEKAVSLRVQEAVKEERGKCAEAWKAYGDLLLKTTPVDVMKIRRKIAAEIRTPEAGK